MKYVCMLCAMNKKKFRAFILLLPEYAVHTVRAYNSIKKPSRFH